MASGSPFDRLTSWVLRRGERARQVILLVLVAGVPLLFLRVVNDPFNVPKLALLIALVSIVGALRLMELALGRSADGLTRLIIPAALVVGPLLLSWVFSPYKGWALFGLYGRFQGLIPYVVVVLAGILIADAFAGPQIRELAWTIAGAAAAVGFYALLQLLGMDPFLWNLAGRIPSHPIATLGNPNFAGGFLGISLPILIVLWISERQHRHRIAYMSGLVAVGWLATQSQGGWIAGIAGLIVVVGFIGRGRFAWTPFAAGALVTLLAVSVAVFIAWHLRDQPPLGTSPSSALSRAWMWDAAVGMGLDHPIVGRGPNTFALEGVQYRPLEDAVWENVNFADNPHSVYLSIFTSAGFVGLAGFVVLMGWVVYRAARIQPEQLLSVGFLGSVAGYLVQAVPSIDEVSLRFAFWVALGGLVASMTPEAIEGLVRTSKKKQAANKKASKSSRSRGREVPRPGYAVIIVLSTLIGLAGCVVGARFVWADAVVLDAREAAVKDDVESLSERAKSALGLRSDTEYKRLFARLLSESAEPNDLNVAFLQEIKHHYAFVQELPYVNAMLEYGRALASWAEVVPATEEEAVAIFSRALELDPMNPILRMEAADAFTKLKRYDLAIQVIEPALPAGRIQYPEVLGAAAIAFVKIGDIERAEELIDLMYERFDAPGPRGVEAEKLIADLEDESE